MSVEIYVGNLPYDLTDDELASWFESYGCTKAIVIIDRYTGGGRGYGFVTLDDEYAEAAMYNIDGVEYEGKRLVCSLAQKREERPKSMKPMPGRKEYMRQQSEPQSGTR